MDRGAWWAIVHGITELDTTEQLTYVCVCVCGERERESMKNLLTYKMGSISRLRTSFYPHQCPAGHPKNHVLFFTV